MRLPLRLPPAAFEATVGAETFGTKAFFKEGATPLETETLGVSTAATLGLPWAIGLEASKGLDIVGTGAETTGPLGTSGRETEEPKTVPIAANGKPRRMRGTANRTFCSNNSYALPARRA